MAPAKPKEKAAKAAVTPGKKDQTKKVKSGKVSKIKKGKPRNYDLGNGVYRFSKTKMFHKKAKYKFIGKKHPKVS